MVVKIKDDKIKTVTATDVVNMLNDMLLLDPNGVNALFKQRTMINDKLANHPTLQCLEVPNLLINDPNRKCMVYIVGLIGILNGIFHEEGDDSYIVAHYNHHNEYINKFSVMKLKGV